MFNNETCRPFLKATRATASRATRKKFAGCAVLGDRFSGFTVELRDGTQYEMGREHCRYCARSQAIIKHGTED